MRAIEPLLAFGELNLEVRELAIHSDSKLPLIQLVLDCCLVNLKDKIHRPQSLRMKSFIMGIIEERKKRRVAVYQK